MNALAGQKGVKHALIDSTINYQMNVDAVNQIGGALQKLNTDGAVDAAGTQQELADLKAQLGNSFTQGTVSNDLNTTFT